jgi:isoleucyl-tRNA synthetase
MLLNGYIYRGRKPVHWSPSSGTALAEAELEYPEGHTSPSIYVAMPLASMPSGASADALAALEGAAFAIWTTTPWTIPANLAVAVNGDLKYAVVEAEGERAEGLLAKRLVVAEDLIDTLAEKWGLGLRKLAVLSGSELEGATYTHPLYGRTSPLVIGGDYITTESGTGLVHTAPGHGQEDYQVGCCLSSNLSNYGDQFHSQIRLDLSSAPLSRFVCFLSGDFPYL